MERNPTNVIDAVSFGMFTDCQGNWKNCGWRLQNLGNYTHWKRENKKPQSK
ncbi:rCG29221 [Rattus norvegicus]|uniref:RCG29221 n=1 Tax=Rattus norvegicus TaxID=10116 RepID=A6K853_RAT|nr:rCG29221 [Rattus norvegicus]